MSIQLRLNLAIGLLSALGLFCMIGFILIDAKPRMEVENASTMLLTETLIKSSLLPLKDSSDPKAALAQLIDELKILRHASVSLASRNVQPAADNDVDDIEQTWLSRWKGVALEPLRIPVEVRGKLLDTIIITPKPGDELSELLEAIVRIFEWGVIISAVTLLLTWLIINGSLSPIRALRGAMQRMEAGDFDFSVAEAGPPEIQSICRSLNGLATALKKARSENQRLSSHLISIQDQERRDIARELHDELGPYLFSIRTDGTLLARELDKPAPDLARARRLNRQILGHVDLLQQTNRRVLQRLTPPGLSELGLAGALRAMIEMWRRNNDTIDLELTIEGSIDGLDDTTELTVYRVVQEGLTNAFRHSGASRITARVTGAEIGKELAADNRAKETVSVLIRDNGHGTAETVKDGFGLKAMRDRVSTLSGSVQISHPSAGGTELRIELPTAQRSYPSRGISAATEEAASANDA